MILGAFILALNAAFVAGTSWRLYGLFFRNEDPGMIGQWLWLLLTFVGQVVLVGLLLGYTGLVHANSFLALHAATFFLARHFISARESDGIPVRNWVNQRWTTIQWLERAGLIFVAGVLLLYLFTGTIGERLVHDANTYRLSRVAHWLQEGSIRHFPTNELRQNYHSINADLVIMWLMAPFPRGYPLANLVQFLGGIMTLAATFGFARLARLRRESCISALVLLFLMPNFVVQWSTCQSDLFTTGLLWSGLYFLYQSLRQCHLALPAWLGIALAIGTKGTVLYMGFGLLAAGVIWMKAARPTAAVWKMQISAAAVALLVFAAPRYIENAVHYGNPFAPPDVYALNHGHSSNTQWLSKLELNLRSYFIQTIEPVSNPQGMKRLIQGPWSALIEDLPEQDPYSNTHYPRRKWLRYFGETTDPGADTFSSGIILPLLALAGAILVFLQFIRTGGEPVRLLSSLALIPILFMLFFGLMFLWWPTSFRYFVLIAPPAAILAARLIESFRPTVVIGVGVGTLLMATIIVASTYTRPMNAGSVQLRPNTSKLAYLAKIRAQRKIIDTVLPAGSRVGVYLDWNRPLSGFYRNQRKSSIRLIRLPELLQLPNLDFLQRNGLDAVVTEHNRIPPAPPGMTHELVHGGNPNRPVCLVHLPIQPLPKR